MIAMARDPDDSTGFLLEDFLAADAHTPDGYRAQFIDGQMIVAAPQEGNHESVVGAIAEQVALKSAERMQWAGHKGLIVPSFGEGDDGRAIPDLTCAPRSLELFRGAPPWMEVAGVALVVEVTSTRPEVDREAKRRAYAAAGIPLYLLADREVQRVTLFTHPAAGDYQRTAMTPFGGELELPEPFAFTLDTTDFA